MKPKVKEYTRKRGAMLKALAKARLKPVDSKVLYCIVADLGYEADDTELDGHVTYLVNGGYVTREERSAGGVTVVMVTITKEGIDLLDGINKADDGVNVEFD